MARLENIFGDYEQQKTALERLRRFDGSGGGGYDGGMEARVAKLESTTEYIQRDISELKEDVRSIRKDMNLDFRLTWVGIITLGLGLAGLLAKGFHWL